MAAKNVILYKSARMSDGEGRVVRMSEAVRAALGVNVGQEVEMWPEGAGAQERMAATGLYIVKQAYKEDLRLVNKENTSGTPVVFVTERTKGFILRNKWRTACIAKGMTCALMGADPEFLLMSNDSRVVCANDVLPFQGKLGSDGYLAEIRPDPALSPEELVKNMQTILTQEEDVKRIYRFYWKAGCYYEDDRGTYSLGGHLHIGNPKYIERLSTDKRTKLFNVVNKILDELLGVLGTRFEGRNEGSYRRTIKGYGRFGDWRLSQGRLEYRTLSGAWMKHPEIAVSVIGAAKAISEEAFQRWKEKNFDMTYISAEGLPPNRNIYMPDFSSWDEIEICSDMGCTKPSSEMIALLHNAEIGAIDRSFVSKWHRQMRSLSTYNAYMNYIDRLRELLTLPHTEIQKFGDDLKKNWCEGKPSIIS